MLCSFELNGSLSRIHFRAQMCTRWKAYSWRWCMQSYSFADQVWWWLSCIYRTITHTYKHRLLFFYSVLSDLAFVDEKNSPSSLHDRSNLNERPVVFFIVLLSPHIEHGICIRPSCSGMNSSRVSMICCSFGVTPLDLKSLAQCWVIITWSEYHPT